jgi:fucose permease
VLGFGFVSFFAFGLVLVLVGANQAQLERDLSLSLAQSGLLSSALAIGLGVGVIGAGPLFDRFPRRPLFAGSMLLAAAALLLVERDMRFDRWLAHLVVAGIGIGGYDTLLNAAIVQTFGDRSARPMAATHAAATLGAMSGPLLAGALAGHAHWIASFQLAGAVHVALAGAVLFVPLPAPEPRAGARTAGAISALLLPFAAISFAYVGIEAALTVFAVPYAGHLGLPATRGQLAISAFWLGLLAGRVGALWARVHLDARLLRTAGAAATLAILAGSLTSIAWPEATLFATGVALGCVYPLMMALAGQTSPGAHGLATGLAAGAGALGGFAIPWLTGAVGDTGGVSVAIASLAGWSALIAVAAAAARRPR